jgi:hypothetical protein
MTTCVNQEKKGYAGKAVSATLAGVLAVGMVPAAAFAEAVPQGEEDSLELLTAGVDESIAAATINTVAKQDGTVVSDYSNYKVTVGTGEYILPANITLYGSNETVDIINADGEINSDYKVGLFTTSDISSTISGASSTADSSSPSWKATTDTNIYYVGDIDDNLDLTTLPAGKYYAVIMDTNLVTTGTSFAEKTLGVAFSVQAKTFDGAVLLNGDEKTDTTFTYTGESGTTVAGKINLLINDEVVEPGTGQTANYTVGIYQAGTTSSTQVTSNTLNAGNYVAKITGAGAYSGKSAEIPFTVEKLDISTANIVLDTADFAATGTVYPTTINTVAGILYSNLSTSDVNALEFVSGTLADGSTVYTVPGSVTAGTFKYKVSAKSSSANVTGEKTVEVVRYTTDISSTITYNSNTGTSSNGGYVYTLASGAFDATKLSVKNGSTDVPYTISYTKVTGNAANSNDEAQVDVTDTTAAGTYYAVVTAKATDLSAGGVFKVKFTVASTAIAANQVYVTYDGTLLTNYVVNEIYTGEDILKNFAVSARANNATVDPANLEITAVKYGTTTKVSEIVDAGKYTIKINAKEGTNYTLSEQTITVTVSPVTVGSISYNATIQLAGKPTVGGQKNAYAYTGSAVVPTFEYDLTGDTTSIDYSKTTAWVSLPSAAYNVTYFKSTDSKVAPETGTLNTDYILGVDDYYYAKADSATAAGDYVAVLKTAKGVTNYNINTQVAFKVTADKYFIDVPVGTWYYDTIYKAASLGYMTGYDGTDYFGPNDNLTRAQAVVVLYKMAGAQNVGAENNGPSYTDVKYKSKFTDVDESGWYAQALAWAVSANIVTGTSDTTFEPNRDVTRQEFVLMLQRYAKANNDDVTADASVLKTYADANAVDSWATDGVAWAVSNKIAGVDTTVLNPKGGVKRAEVAAMAVRYQPVKDSTIPVNQK